MTEQTPLAPEFISHDQVYAAFTPADAVATLRETLRNGFDPAGDQSRSAVPVENGEFLIMPSATSSAFGIKLLSVAPPGYHDNLPRIQGSYLLFDGTTLSPRALIDGIAVTNLRTPAVSISCIYDFLADNSRENANGAADSSAPLKVAIFGTGPQGRSHAATVESTFPDRELSFTFISRTQPQDLDDRYHWTQAGSEEAREATRAADLILCTTTASEPILTTDDVSDSAVIVAVGSHSPDARELATDLVASATVIVEDMGATLREGGDVIKPLNEGALRKSDLLSYADVVSGKVQVARDKPIVFNFTGMPWEDLALAEAIAEKVSAQG
ncbi:ornithine cyclodeaminase family protein [Corynebacterium pseudodiphtheriticum]|uniref:ornithine cyclodeaminase family protein n=1 Tax=Corynebacterium pseudodiphtheriticum TaxID=37637 RepID=UPI00254BFE95|nr:ornithine cyclodeaminase family protein [Corynebacterium pseudodiphtheriticum]MDK8546312.1 ornithine cyclodeaminase family protein [Corynebacterium pseudodiphtheriticum]MDK8709721.1 ornithine cyclodeaminase family protein [Corynebacterium pseudodiphtheriticum]